MGRITDRSIEGVGVLIALVSIGHLLHDPHTVVQAIGESAIPFLVSGAVIAFGHWLHQRSDTFDRPTRARIALGHLAGGIFFSMVVMWALSIGTLEGGEFSQEALVSILLNGGALGAATTGVAVAGGLRIRQQRDILRERAARLEKLASIISHDLRSPLSVAQGRIELARETGDTSHLDPCVRALTRIERIIEDMLTLVRETQAVDTTTVVELDAVANTAWEMVDTDELALHVERSLQFQADKTQLRQVFENLFRNATEHGGETVTMVRVGPLGTDGFYVEDDGTGIPAEKRDDVFDWGMTTHEDGTGLGLAIVQEIATAHGWTITVTDSSSGGARFGITGVESWAE